MRYNSTRDNQVSILSSQAVVQGLSLDGGLFVPQSFPRFTLDDIKEFSAISYNERAVRILSKFFTDFKESEIEECVNSAYNKERFETAEIAPTYKMDDNIYILELWHGPTCAFKDMALQILPHLLTKSMKKVNLDGEVVILVATSGDTGKAALEGFKDVEGTRIIVFYPHEGVSEMQKLQMVTQEGQNVCVIAVSGNFDDAQNGVKGIFIDEEYQNELKQKGFYLSSANSINWGRLAPQIVYYFSTYADLLRNEEIQLGEEINIVVPTGNFGNILAAYYAKKMGLPVAKLICASNKNNVLTDFINTGIYNKNREFFTTISPSMDILISSNLERFIYDIAERDDEKVRQYMKKLATDGTYQLEPGHFSKMQGILYGGFADDEKTLQTIKEIEEEYSYVLDTHTAVAMAVYMDYVEKTKDTKKTVIASTASPYKFNRSVLQALGEEDIEDQNEFILLEKLAKKTQTRAPKALQELEVKPVRFNQVITKDQMKEVVKNYLFNS